MDFELTEFCNSVMQPIGDPDVEKIVVGGEEMRAYIFPNKVFMSPGTWNGWYYSPDELQQAYNNTDWSETINLNLFADHEDKDTSAWIGYIRNPHMEGQDLKGDLVVVDNNYAKKLMFGAKFGISPKLFGQGIDGAVKGSTYENFSVVVNPACKTTFLNSEEEQQETEDKKSEESEMTKKEEKPIEEETKVEVAPVEVEKEEPQVDESVELIAKLSDKVDKLTEGVAATTDKLDEVIQKAEEEADEPEPDETKTEEKVEETEDKAEETKVETVDEEPQRASIKDSELEVETPGTFSNADSGMVKYLRALDKGNETFELSMVEEKSNTPWMTFSLAGATAVTSVRGTSRTAYNLLPTQWAKAIVDAGKNLMFFSNSVRQATVPKGTNDYIMPIRQKYEDTWETSAEEYAVDTNVTATVLNDMDGVQFTPTRYNYRVAITNKAVNTNAIDLVRFAREELAYKWGNDVDGAIATGLAAASAAADTAPGRMDLYGGDATSLATLAAGDVLDTDLIAEGMKMLQSKFNYYWTGGTLTKDTTLKNPWQNTADAPFMLYIAPEQEQALRTDSQFVNASEYGANDVVLNGEIGKYLGTKVLVSNNVPTDSTTVDGHKCLLVKSQYCGGIAWGQKPVIKAFDWPMSDQKQIILNFEYDVQPLQGDAIVLINVADNDA